MSNEAHIVAIINGTSKKGIRFGEKIRNSSPAIEVILTNARGHAAELALAAAQAHASHILAIGGDGTVNEVLNGIMKARSKDPSLDPVLGIVPAGTANDFAHTIGAARNIEGLIRALDRNQTEASDVGSISFPDGRKRCFMNIASMGLGGKVVQLLENSNKRLGADLSFLMAITRTFLSYKRTEVICKWDDGKWKGEMLALALANGKRFGSGIYIAPDASWKDGLLELVIIGKVSIWEYVKNVGKLKKGKKIDHPAISYLRTREVEVTPVVSETLLESDGELIGVLPCSIKVLPEAIRLLVWTEALH